MKKNVVLSICVAITIIACNNQPKTAAVTLDSSSIKRVENQQVNIPPGPVPNTILTEAYVKNLATSVYAWGWPMANIFNRLELFKEFHIRYMPKVYARHIWFTSNLLRRPHFLLNGLISFLMCKRKKIIQ